MRGRTFVTLAVSAVIAVGCGDAEVPLTVDPGEALPGLTDAERGRFLLGRALFERLATQDEGLGPLFNAERCSSCHETPDVGGGGDRILVLKATRLADGFCDGLRAVGGDNIQQRATDLLVAHGMGPEVVPAEATDQALVTSPPLFGLGLLETVPDSVLERLADPDDGDGDGISGRLPRLADGRSARFGPEGRRGRRGGLRRQRAPLPSSASPRPTTQWRRPATASCSPRRSTRCPIRRWTSGVWG